MGVLDSTHVETSARGRASPGLREAKRMHCSSAGTNYPLHQSKASFNSASTTPHLEAHDTNLDPGGMDPTLMPLLTTLCQQIRPKSMHILVQRITSFILTGIPFATREIFFDGDDFEYHLRFHQPTKGKRDPPKKNDVALHPRPVQERHSPPQMNSGITCKKREPPPLSTVAVPVGNPCNHRDNPKSNSTAPSRCGGVLNPDTGSTWRCTACTGTAVDAFVVNLFISSRSSDLLRLWDTGSSDLLMHFFPCATFRAVTLRQRWWLRRPSSSWNSTVCNSCDIALDDTSDLSGSALESSTKGNELPRGGGGHDSTRLPRSHSNIGSDAEGPPTHSALETPEPGARLEPTKLRSRTPNLGQLLTTSVLHMRLDVTSHIGIPSEARCLGLKLGYLRLFLLAGPVFKKLRKQLFGARRRRTEIGNEMPAMGNPRRYLSSFGNHIRLWNPTGAKVLSFWLCLPRSGAVTALRVKTGDEQSVEKFVSEICECLLENCEALLDSEVLTDTGLASLPKRFKRLGGLQRLRSNSVKLQLIDTVNLQDSLLGDVSDSAAECNAIAESIGQLCLCSTHIRIAFHIQEHWSDAELLGIAKLAVGLPQFFLSAQRLCSFLRRQYIQRATFGLNFIASTEAPSYFSTGRSTNCAEASGE